MNRSLSKRAKHIQKILNDYFPAPPIPLKHHSRYTLLIAVLLSARCTDARVNTITPELFALADTPEAMIKLDPKLIQSIIRPCGLSERKALAIWELSKILLEKYHGEVPCEIEALEQLPGVGHKTASVVMAQAFQTPAFPIDTHILRSARRWGLSKAKSPSGIERDLKVLYPREDWILLHLQIISFARAFCPARGHDPTTCPICSTL